MIIDNDLVVKIGDGTAVFDEPSFRDWAILVDMKDRSIEEQADLLIPKLKELKGFQYRDGRDVTVEDIKSKNFSAKFFLMLVQAWTKAIIEGLSAEAAEKKAVTLN